MSSRAKSESRSHQFASPKNRACHPERSEGSAFFFSRIRHSFQSAWKRGFSTARPKRPQSSAARPAQILLKFVERTTHKAYDTPDQRPNRRTLGRITNPSTRPACDRKAARNPLWLVAAAHFAEKSLGRWGQAVICHPDRRLDGVCRAGVEGSLVSRERRQVVVTCRCKGFEVRESLTQRWRPEISLVEQPSKSSSTPPQATPWLSPGHGFSRRGTV